MSFIQRSLPQLADGVAVTAALAATSLIGAGFGGLAVAALRASRRPVVRTASSAYVELMRNTPILVQLAILYFGLPSIGLYPDAFTSAAIALTLQNAAYTGEIYRAGIGSISRGQREAAASLGLHPFSTYRLVVLPQALARVLPALSNQAVVIVKDTSVASTVALAELTSSGKLLLDRSAAPYETFFLIAALYLALNVVVLGVARLAALRLPVRM